MQKHTELVHRYTGPFASIKLLNLAAFHCSGVCADLCSCVHGSLCIHGAHRLSCAGYSPISKATQTWINMASGPNDLHFCTFEYPTETAYSFAQLGRNRTFIRFVQGPKAPRGQADLLAFRLPPPWSLSGFSLLEICVQPKGRHKRKQMQRG